MPLKVCDFLILSVDYGICNSLRENVLSVKRAVQGLCFKMATGGFYSLFVEASSSVSSCVTPSPWGSHLHPSAHAVPQVATQLAQPTFSCDWDVWL